MISDSRLIPREQDYKHKFDALYATILGHGWRIGLDVVCLSVPLVSLLTLALRPTYVDARSGLWFTIFQPAGYNYALPSTRRNMTSDMILFFTENGRKSDFRPAKLPPHRYSMCHLVVFCGLVFFFMGESAGKSEQTSDLNSAIRGGVIHAGLGDQTECGTSWRTV